MLIDDLIVGCNVCSRGYTVSMKTLDEEFIRSLECRNCHSDNIQVIKNSDRVIVREGNLIHGTLF